MEPMTKLVTTPDGGTIIESHPGDSKKKKSWTMSDYIENKKKRLVYKIVRFKRQNGLSTEKVARMFGVTATTISNWESGRNFPCLSHDGVDIAKKYQEIMDQYGAGEPVQIIEKKKAVRVKAKDQSDATDKVLKDVVGSNLDPDTKLEIIKKLLA